MADDFLPDLDPTIRAIAERYLAEGTNKRALLVLKMLLENGSVTTAEIQAKGYDHPPRAIGDVRDAGFPLIMEWIKDASGRRMGRFRFGNADAIREGRFAGRIAIPKAFRNRLLAFYGEMDCITGASVPATMMQVDHRVPYRVVGDPELGELLIADFMLLDASSQRSKSWSCERCENWTTILDPAVCRNCFWASPEAYAHVAMMPVRRTDIIWRGSDVPLHDRMKARADAKGIADLLVRFARKEER